MANTADHHAGSAIESSHAILTLQPHSAVPFAIAPRRLHFGVYGSIIRHQFTEGSYLTSDTTVALV